MKTILFLCLLCIAPFSSLLSQERNFQREYDSLFYIGTPQQLSSILSSWEKKTPQDPELLIAWYNFYVKSSAHEVPLSKGSQVKEGSDTATVTMQYDAEKMKKAYTYLDKGILLYPDRLDMRFGKIYMLGQTGNYDAFTKQIIEMTEYGYSIKNMWKLPKKATAKNEETLMLGTIQLYVGTLLDIGDAQGPHIRTICEEVIKHNPERMDFLFDLGVTYMFKEEWDKALPELLKAEKLSPSDISVLNNIAFCYQQKNDKTNAIAYFEKIVKVGNEEDKSKAEEEIKKLKQK
jgi:tetratricopeptide (TPR) repeat protein